MNAAEIARLVLTVALQLIDLGKSIANAANIDAPELRAAIAEANDRATAALTALGEKVRGG